MKKITKILSSGLVLGVFLTPVLFLSASENEEGRGPIDASIRADVKMEMKGGGLRFPFIKPVEKIDDRIERKEDHREKIEERMSSTTASTSKKRMEKMEKFSERLDNQIDRLKELREKLLNREFKIIPLLENISTRIGERIKIMEGRGAILTEAKDLLASANLKIEAAADAAEDLKVLIEAEVNATTTATTTVDEEAREEIRAAAEKVKGLLKEAHKLLSETVQKINFSIKVRATSTVETN